MNPQNQLANKLRKVESSSITAKNKQILKKFTQKCLSESMSERRIVKYLNYMTKQATFLNKDFNLTDRDDMEKLVIWIERQEWAEWTKYDNKMMLKRLFKWLEGDDEEYPKKLRWLKPRMKNNKLMAPEELLTDSDIEKMLDTSTSIRDRALVSVLYESGCRISEFCNMKIKDAREDDYGFVIHVSGKTGPRRIRLLDSMPYLANWLTNHPNRGDKESDLWVCTGTTNHAKKMQYNTVRKVLQELAQRTNITKPINPHAFRKANSTKLAGCMTEFELKERQGWTPDSKVAAIYVRLSGKNVDDAYFRAKGICVKCKKAKAVNNNLCEACLNGNNHVENKLEPRKCPRCPNMCEPTAKLCSQCGFPLTVKVAEELLDRRKKADQIMNVATQYPEMMALLEKIIRKEGL